MYVLLVTCINRVVPVTFFITLTLALKYQKITLHGA